MIILCRRPFPYWDQWDNLISGREITMSWLLSQHNEHRLFFPRLMFWADARFFDERNDLMLVANVALQAGIGGLLTAMALRCIDTGRNAKIVIGSFIFALVFLAMQWENLASPFQVQFFLVCIAAVFVNCQITKSKLEYIDIILVSIFEIVAVWSLASGLIITLNTIIMSLYFKRSRATTVWFVILAAALIAGYFYGYSSPSQAAGPAKDAVDIFGVGEFLLIELGAFPGPLAGFDSLGTRLLSGTVGIILFLILATGSVFRPNGKARAEVSLLGLSAFVVGMCLLTALGRLNLGLVQATAGRYNTAVILFWIAIFLLVVSRLPPKRQVWGILGLGLITLIGAVREPRLAVPAIRLAHRLNAAAPALIVPNGDTGLLQRLYPVPGVVSERREGLESAHASIFAEDWTGWLGKPFTEGSPGADLPRCEGDIAETAAVSDGTRSGWRVTGHFSGPSGRMVPKLIFLDPSGTVIGLGVAGLDAASIDDDRDKKDLASDRWLAELLATDLGSIKAYAMDRDNKIFCTLGMLR